MCQVSVISCYYVFAAGNLVEMAVGLKDFSMVKYLASGSKFLAITA